MCRLCGSGAPLSSCPTRRDYLGLAGTASAEAAAATLNGSTAAQDAAAATLPKGIGEAGRKVLIKGGAVLSVDDSVGNFPVGDVLIDGSLIAEVGANIDAPDAVVIDASGKIVMPGFIDTHHHQFETALRGVLADAILINDGRPESEYNYYEKMLQTFSMVYRPEDVYINELFGSIAQLDDGVTTVMDVSQIHHSPEHSDAAIEGLRDAGRRSVFGYFEGWGDDAKYPEDARRIKAEHFASDDQLITMVMGGEIYLPGYEKSWEIGRELGLPIALHVVGTFGMQETFDALGAAGKFGPDNIFIHMTGMSDEGWNYAADAGVHISLSVPIEMHMRHGAPPIQKAIDHGLRPSLSTDVECTMTADAFTQMRSMVTLQRMFANELALAGEDYPTLLTAMDAIRSATIEGARGLKLEKKTGSLTPGKEADIILLDAEALNVAPLNHVPGAVVTLMERTNVDTVFVAGRIKKWRGALMGFDLARLRRELETSRDYVFQAAGIDQDLFRY
ncbi:amidohydrolase family protein [Roseibium aggregatum]|uniref:Amidohydrolase family protein n=1 Tax=Roseibium aggregatum TaxID=187304 RepID=A0A926S8B6_9HYPH|nr:amidohydrolase family protein [Roseibium aggregatum]MBD1548512.1 amidohydrolase family protein [Roseibium aggregatum]